MNKFTTKTFLIISILFITGLMFANVRAAGPIKQCAVDDVNCATKTITPVGVLTVTGCKIEVNKSTCNNTLHWSVTKSVIANTATVSTSLRNIIGSGSSGDIIPTISHGNTTFNLNLDGDILKTSTVSASCVPGSTWNKTICASDYLASADLSSNPLTCTIPLDGTYCDDGSTLTWTTSGISSASSYEVFHSWTSTNSGNNIISQLGSYSGTAGSASVSGSHRAASNYYGANIFYISLDSGGDPTGGTKLAEISITANCASGSSWDASLKKCALVYIAPKTAEDSLTVMVVGGEIPDVDFFKGSIDPAGCSIDIGKNNCDISILWKVKNPISEFTASVTTNYPNDNTIVANGNSGETKYNIPYGYTPFYLYYDNPNVSLSFFSAKAECTEGSVWDVVGKVCKGVPVACVWKDWSPAVSGCGIPTNQTRSVKSPAKYGGLACTGGNSRSFTEACPVNCPAGSKVDTDGTCCSFLEYNTDTGLCCSVGQKYNPTTKLCIPKTNYNYSEN